MKQSHSSRQFLTVIPPSIRWAAAILLLALIVLLPAIPLLYQTPDTDASIFLFIGNKIRLGQLPFRDWYDHKPPLIFYLNALGLWLGQGSRWGVWFVEYLSLSAAGWFGFSFLRRYYGALIATLAVGATFLNLAFVHQRGNMTEEYALPFQFAAIYLLGSYIHAGRMNWKLFGIGCMLAMASSLKQPLAGTGVALVAYLLVDLSSRDAWRKLLSSLVWIGLGFAVIWAGWFLYFFAAGIFADFWEAAFAYNVALAGIPLDRRVHALVSAFHMLFGWSGFFLGGMLAWIAVFPYLLQHDERFVHFLCSRWMGGLLAAAGLFLALKGSDTPLLIGTGGLFLLLGALFLSGWQQRRAEPWLLQWQVTPTSPLLLPLMIALVDLPVAMAFSSLSGNNFAHYFMALLPSLTLLIAFLIRALLDLFTQATSQPVRYAFLAVLLIPIFAQGIYETADRIGPRGDRQLEAVIDYVKTHTRPEDYVLQWGIVPQVNLLSGRDAPSRYFFPDPLFVDGYSGAVQTSELLRDLQAHPPVLIVNEGIARLPLLLPSTPGQCAAVKDPHLYVQYVKSWEDRAVYNLPQMPVGMDAVYFWICQNYAPVGPVGELGWQVYRLKGK